MDIIKELTTSLTLYGPAILSVCKYHLIYIEGDEQRAESTGNKSFYHDVANVNYSLEFSL